jgi:hypothetical protein
MSKFFITILFFSNVSLAADYCLSVRGNGELIASHWGAMASVVEKLGLPKAQAGGSSASISIFLLDGIASSKMVKQQPETAVFLIKSLEGVTYWMKNQKEWQDFASLAVDAQSLGSADWAQELNKIFTEVDQAAVTSALQVFYDNLGRIQRNLEVGRKLNLINVESFARLSEAVRQVQTSDDLTQAQGALKTAKFYAGELYKTYEVFGKFNAEADDNLFFRAGIVNFDGLARQAGRIAGFYANASSQNKNWNELYTSCSEDLKNKTWSELVEAQPRCQNLLENTIDKFFRTSGDDFSQKNIGETIVSFPITSVLVDSAYRDAKVAMENYHQNLDPEFGKTFSLTNYDDVRFGYWGRRSALKNIAQNLDYKDAKSQRFLALSEATWYEALRLSPAEPGLSALREFSSSRKTYLSAGGWPDLTPTLILKAYGCKNIVHITRRGGESLFAQGVAKRLLNLDRDWSLLRTTPESYDDNWVLNNLGDRSDLSSNWAQLYNVANDSSSYKKSLRMADAILCTDWNQFKITDGPSAMIAHAYISPFYVNKDGGLFAEEALLQPQLNPKEQHPAGYPEYIGCTP